MVNKNKESWEVAAEKVKKLRARVIDWGDTSLPASLENWKVNPLDVPTLREKCHWALKAYQQQVLILWLEFIIREGREADSYTEDSFLRCYSRGVDLKEVMEIDSEGKRN